MSCSASSGEDGAVLEFGLEVTIGLFFIIQEERWFCLPLGCEKMVTTCSLTLGRREAGCGSPSRRIK
jgi:hypothetical protein